MGAQNMVPPACLAEDPRCCVQQDLCLHVGSKHCPTEFPEQEFTPNLSLGYTLSEVVGKACCTWATVIRSDGRRV